MGNNTSKSCNDTVICTQKNDVDLSASSDPRSPTPEIIRTPLQGKPNGKHNITKNVDLRKTFENAKAEEKLIHNNPILSAVIKNHLQSYDPRSPTQEFERTPIIITSKINQLENDKNITRLQSEINCGSPCLRNDNYEINESSVEEINSPDLVIPKNLCDGFYDITLNDTLKEPNEPLGSSTASNEAIEADISDTKSTKLLETNFEYVETEIDKFEDTEENVPSIDGADCNKNDVHHIPVFKILDEDPRSPSIGIDRTPIVVAMKAENVSNDNVEHMSDDSLIKVLQNTNAELRQNVAKPVEKNSEGLLIYEDESESINDTPKKSKSVGNSGSRTPLSCMKNKTDTGHSRSKSANTLYDPKNPLGPSKVSRRVSHIPRLKSLSKPIKVVSTGSTISLKSIGKTSTLGGDCENTPPHSHHDKWDKNSSIVL